MNKKYFLVTLSTLALVANLLLPGLAMGQFDQVGSQDITQGELVIKFGQPGGVEPVDGSYPPSNFVMDALSVETADSYTWAECIDGDQNGVCGDAADELYQQTPAGTALPEAGFVAVEDLAGLDAGWVLQVSQSGFTKAASWTDGNVADDMPLANFTMVTTPDVTIPSFMNGASTPNANGIYYDVDSATTTGGYEEEVISDIDVAASTDLRGTDSTAPVASFTTSIGTAGGSETTIMTNQATIDGGHNPKVGRFGTGLAYQLKVDSGQEAGTYTNTLTYTLQRTT